MANKHRDTVLIFILCCTSMGSSLENSLAKLRIKAFDRRDCVGTQVQAEATIAAHEDCFHFDSNTPSLEREEQGILNGYVSCCYDWGQGGFRSINILNSDPSAFDGCTLTKFTGLDCDGFDQPETAGSLDKAETCMNVFYDTGAEGAPSNNQAALALRVDCITTNLSSIASSSTIATNFASSPSIIASSKTLNITTAKTLPSECYPSARPSNPARFHETPRVVTYVTELEPVTEAVTSVLTFVPDYWYGPRQYFTVVGPTTQFVTVTAELTPDVVNLFNPDNVADYCQDTCGPCSIYFPYVDVLYWPVSSMNTACLGNKTVATSHTTLAPDVRARELSVADAGEGTLISSGHTLVSPSAYLVFPGVSAADGCGRRGSYYTSVTLAVAPEDLSSVVAHSPESLNIADLLCLPASLQPGGSYWEHSPWNNYPIRFVGDYKPIISPPPQLSSLDPSWAGCHADPFQGQDPPRALVPAAVLTPEATILAPTASPTHLQPSHAPASPWPKITEFPKTDISGDPSLKPTSKDVSRPDKINGPEPQQDQSQNDDPASVPGSHAPSRPDGVDGKPEGGSGGAIVSIKPDSGIVMDETRLLTNSVVITVAGNPYTISQGKDGIVVAGQTISPDGPAITMSGEVISAAANGIVVGSQMYSVHADADRSSNPDAALDGPIKSDNAVANSKTPFPTGQADPTIGPIFVHQGNPPTVSAGGSRSDILGSAVSPARPDRPATLVESDTVVVNGSPLPAGDPTALPGVSEPTAARGSRTRLLDSSNPVPSNPASATSAVVITVGDQRITVNPTRVHVGTLATLTPGSPGFVVSGTPVSLNAQGLLVIAGTRTVSPPSEEPSGSSSSVGLGGLILAGLGGASGSAPAPEGFRGVAERLEARGVGFWGFFVGAVVVVVGRILR